MRLIYIIKKTSMLTVLASAFMLSSCNDFLDRAPLDAVTPDVYLKAEADLAAYSIGAYNFPHHGSNWGIGNIITGDNHSDNAATSSASYTNWVKGEWRVPESDGSYAFSAIRNANYFFEKVLTPWKEGKIVGDPTNINHYIGEMYVIRAWEYFSKLKRFGDFPIVKRTFPDQKDILIEASKRSPRNEVARFIIQDLDSAIMLMKDNMNGNRRLTKKVAQLLKSRVALYEGSWLTYHKNTAHVPGGPGWPGASKDYNQGFSINIDSEINYFLTQAMEASDAVASSIALTPNTGVLEPVDGATHSGWNSYFEMFGADDMSKYDEVLLWRQYSRALNMTHALPVYIRNGGNHGITKGFVDTYLMADGTPIYTSNNYKGDVTTKELKEGRDQRLQLFVFDEDMRVTMDVFNQSGEERGSLFNFAKILQLVETRDVTGYRQRKFYNYDPNHAPSTTMDAEYGSISFRAVEAYLNYIEACYIKNGSLDGKAKNYWKAVRERAGVNSDFDKTIAATDLNKENDWAVYSAGKQVDPTLYNIRRERRCEFISENMRWDDLKRWRALDQVKDYVVEGFKLWDEASENYVEEELDDKGRPTGKMRNLLVQPEEASASKTPNVSSSKDSKYLRPYQIIKTNNLIYNGYTWSKANYLAPMPMYEIRLTASNPDDPTTSPIYQNPHWPVQSNGSALE